MSTKRVFLSTVVLGGLLLATPKAVSAFQSASDRARVLPVDGYFRAPVAAPREPRFNLSFLRTDLLAGAPGEGGGGDTENQVMAGLGGTLPVWKMAQWEDGGVALALQTGVFARFRIDITTNDLLAADWLIALPVEASWGDLEGRLRLLHWSAHLGDEFIESTGATRVGFGYESLELLTAYSFGPARVYGGGALVLRSELDDPERDLPREVSDEASFQAGADVAWHPWRGGDLGIAAGVDWQWDDRTEWRDRMSMAARMEFLGAGRSGSLGFRVGRGMSPVGEFFLTEETYWGVELRVDL